jgi:hypothetical protein
VFASNTYNRYGDVSEICARMGLHTCIRVTYRCSIHCWTAVVQIMVLWLWHRAHPACRTPHPLHTNFHLKMEEIRSSETVLIHLQNYMVSQTRRYEHLKETFSVYAEHLCPKFAWGKISNVFLSEWLILRVMLLLEGTSAIVHSLTHCRIFVRSSYWWPLSFCFSVLS